MYERQHNCYNNILFILQSAKMKSWLLILGAAIAVLNYAAPAAAESKLININQ
jgi:hypothetical protein